MNCTINIKSELSWPFVLYQFCREQYQVMCLSAVHLKNNSKRLADEMYYYSGSDQLTGHSRGMYSKPRLYIKKKKEVM